MIYTSYFANVKYLPQNLWPISIAGRAPDGWLGAEYKRLAPKWEFFKVWKENHDNEYYICEFNSQVLSKLHIPSVVQEILRMTPKGMSPCLICYEKPGDFCHRHLVADWLESGGYIVKEVE